VASVPATAAFRQRRTGQIRKVERVVQLAVSQQSRVGDDAAAMEFQLQAAVEIDPEGLVIRFTRRVFHEPTIMTNVTC